MSHNVDFICLSYKKYDYLIRKDLISASFYLGAKTTDDFSHKTEILGKMENVISLDFIISKEFLDEGKSDESMVIKLRDSFYETTAEAFVKSIDLGEFRFFGKTMDFYCNNSGILAVRYLENNRIQYLFDTDKLIKKFQEKNI